jgi:hypothetical protein
MESSGVTPIRKLHSGRQFSPNSVNKVLECQCHLSMHLPCYN